MDSGSDARPRRVGGRGVPGRGRRLRGALRRQVRRWGVLRRGAQEGAARDGRAALPASCLLHRRPRRPRRLLPALPRVSPRRLAGGPCGDQRGLDERAVCGYATDVATGLAYLHGAGIVHGDVKSRNIVIGADGRAKLMDFGCSRKAGAAADVPIIGGTPAFMAPEVARGEDQGPAADVWALGCTVVEAVRRGAAWTATHSPRCTGSGTRRPCPRFPKVCPPTRRTSWPGA
ncbi:hypothetical protein ZWY2020_044568 [Hordeum vulgare]|nr:hypothetical protein ZWY2020_044568 [Hordeum vulgare]